MHPRPSRAEINNRIHPPCTGQEETIMSEIGKHKLADAVPHPGAEHHEVEGGQPVPTHETAAEQVREAQESKEAHDAEASNRERMVDIGRGNQQAGRQGQ
jgi:hypothetical protein